jgi:hypothetical protein
MDASDLRNMVGARSTQPLGLPPALAADPIVIDTGARMLNGTVLVPTVELAIVIKALAYGSRPQARDVEDVYRLLEITNAYPPHEIGGRRLHKTPLRASRRDAAVHLHELARRGRRFSDVDVPTARLATLIASLVSRPG